VFTRTIKAIIFTAIAVFFVLFAIVNRAVVTVSLFPFPVEAKMPLFLVTLLCFALGIVFGWLAVRPQLAKMNQLYRAEHKRVMALQSEIEAMQPPPAKMPAIANKS